MIRTADAVTVQPIERPKKNKKNRITVIKKHIIKVQLIENEDNKKIIHCQVELEGRNADLTIFKSDRRSGNCFENSS